MPVIELTENELVAIRHAFNKMQSSSSDQDEQAAFYLQQLLQKIEKVDK